MLHEWDVFESAFIGLFGMTGLRIINRDLKIRGRDKLRRLPEVNLHIQACAHEAQIRVLAVLVSPRTPFSLFCRRLENVSILSSLLCWKLSLILDFPWTSRIII